MEFPSLSQHPLPRIQSVRMIWLFGAQRNFSLNTAPPPPIPSGVDSGLPLPNKDTSLVIWNTAEFQVTPSPFETEFKFGQQQQSGNLPLLLIEM